MKINRYFIKMCLFLLLGSVVSGCASREKNVPEPDTPAVITVWHSYNAFAKAVFDKKITEFNETVGMEKGIVVDAFGYGSEDELDEALFNSANQMIGSEPLPNICVIYPDSAARMDKLVPLVELNRYFSTEELERYRPEFLEEGIWGETKTPKLIPVSKSTELLYLNQTDWDKFSAETGASLKDLGTWEGLLAAAEKYYVWSDGKPFMGMNRYNNFAVLTAAQLGKGPFVTRNGRVIFDYPRETAKKVWDHYYVPHIRGWYKSNTYNQDGIKSGTMLAYIGSSAGAGYFPSEVIVSEDQGYEIECKVFPYPTFEGMPDYMTQRGADMGIFTSDSLHEYASAEFIKWFTDPAQNLEFTGAIGYIPVENQALVSIPELIKHVQNSDNSDAVKKSVTAAVEAMEQSKFYTNRNIPVPFEASSAFSNAFDQKIEMDLDKLEAKISQGEHREDVISELLQEENFNGWYDNLVKEMAGKLNE